MRMHPGNIVLNQNCDGAFEDQYTAMDRCRRMTRDVNAQPLLALHVVLVAVWSHVVHVWSSALQHHSCLSVRRVALLADVRVHPLN